MSRTLAPVVDLQPISKDQAPVLENLFQLYAHDFSEHVPLELHENGRFDVTPGDLWWSADDHFGYFLRSNNALCGFALVKRGSRVTDALDVMDIAEFFVVRGARRKDVGTSAAHALFTAFPGRWEIRVRRSNVPARNFWARVIEACAGQAVVSEAFSSEGVEWDVFRLNRSEMDVDAD